MTPTEENQIVERVLKGEREAFAALVDAYKRAIFNLAFRMTDSHQDADDLSQETLIRAYRNLRQFDPRKRFFTWIYTIGLNLIRNHLKKHGREISRENAARRSSDLREAVVLRFYQDLSFEEIATISDTSLSAVKMRVYRGLEQLKRLMEQSK
jgi:RNA polymerase sigma-70 factor (ECF subfamily)